MSQPFYLGIKMYIQLNSGRYCINNLPVGFSGQSVISRLAESLKPRAAKTPSPAKPPTKAKMRGKRTKRSATETTQGLLEAVRRKSMNRFKRFRTRVFRRTANIIVPAPTTKTTTPSAKKQASKVKRNVTTFTLRDLAQLNRDLNQANNSKANIPVVAVPALKEFTKTHSSVWDKPLVLTILGEKDKEVNFQDIRQPNVTPEEVQQFNEKPYSRFTRNYGASWDAKLLSRDIWQNFYDGHGGTLKDVRVTVKRDSGGEFTVKVEGGAIFPYHLLTKLGASGKQGSKQSVGHFGEATKIMPLLLIRDFGAKDVSYTSANWKLSYSLEQSPTAKVTLLKRQLTQTPQTQSGNTFEMKTRDGAFVYQLLQGINQFQGKDSQLAKNATYTNEAGWIKITPGNKGVVYTGGQQAKKRLSFQEIQDQAIVNQQDESNTAAEGTSSIWAPWLPDATVGLHTRPNRDFDRDRSGLSSAQTAKNVIRPIVSKMTDEEVIKAIGQLNISWDEYENSPQRGTSNPLLKELLKAAAKRKLQLALPEKYVSMPKEQTPENLKLAYSLADNFGYVPLHADFAQIGVPTATPQLIKNAITQIKAPDPIAQKRIQIMQEAADLAFSILNGNTPKPSSIQDQNPAVMLGRFHESQSKSPQNKKTKSPVILFPKPEQPKIGLFDKNSEPNKQLKNAGFWLIPTPECLWVDTGLLHKGSFSKVVSTYVDSLIRGSVATSTKPLSGHEYQTLLNRLFSQNMSPTVRKKLQYLKKMWDNTSPQQAKKTPETPETTLPLAARPIPPELAKLYAGLGMNIPGITGPLQPNNQTTSAPKEPPLPEIPLKTLPEVNLVGDRIGPETKKAMVIAYQHLQARGQAKQEERQLAKVLEQVIDENLAPLKEKLKRPTKVAQRYYLSSSENGEFDPISPQDSIFQRNTNFVEPPKKGALKRTRSKSQPFSYQLPSIDDIKNLEGQIRYTVPLSETTKSTGIIPTRMSASVDPNTPEIGQVLPTDTLASYGVQWSRFKRIRDILQNFYDAHRVQTTNGNSGTLEKVVFAISRNDKTGPYKVTIAGHGEYPYQYALLMGMSGKTETPDTAGVNGEGSKLVPLQFLRDGEVKNWTYASGDWALQYTLKPNSNNQLEMHYQLDKKPQAIVGNRLSFETEDPKLIHSLLQGVKLFKHPDRREFNAPTYSKPGLGGFEILPPMKDGTPRKGNVHIAGQRLQVEDEVTGQPVTNKGLAGLRLWVDNRPQSKASDEVKISRDRPALSTGEISQFLIQPLVNSMSDKEIVENIFRLKHYWEVKPEMFAKLGKTKADKDFYVGEESILLRQLVEVARRRNIQTQFPKKYVTIGGNQPPTATQIEALRKKGKIVCWPIFRELGMSRKKDAPFTQYIRKFAALPSDVQKAELLSDLIKKLGEKDLLPKKINGERLKIKFFISNGAKALPEGRIITDTANDEFTPTPSSKIPTKDLKIPSIFWYPSEECLYVNIEALRALPLKNLAPKAIQELTESPYSGTGNMVPIALNRTSAMVIKPPARRIYIDAELLARDVRSRNPAIAITDEEIDQASFPTDEELMALENGINKRGKRRRPSE